tara:strand:- start:28874 stop:30316 length:1443 start_codon:yes stop_codon:yes gene_type:complete
MQVKKPTLFISLIPVITLVTLLAYNVFVFHDDSSYGPNQLALLFTAFLTAGIGHFYLKVDYKELEAKAIDAVGVSLQAIVILLVVGALIGVWILNGVVPTMIFYGIKIINPTLFLPVCLVICSIVSLATGSSWSTVGTVGIALIGIGKTLGIPEGMIAGAIVSGSYFGDKMSPLSDTTNLAPAMAGTDLFSHIRHMVYTSGPAIIISFLLFLGIGLFYDVGSYNPENIDKLLVLMQDNFNISLLLFTLPLIVFVLVYKKMPALPALAIGVILGCVYALIFQWDLISKMNTVGGFTGAYKQVLSVAFDGFKLESGNEVLDKLLSRGGMSGMLNTVWLILMAMIFGGMMEATKMLETIAQSILKLVSSVATLVGATLGTSIFLNLTTSDQYIAIVVSGRMFKNAYDEYDLDPKNLSRAVEDGATVTSVLVPWNTCGAYFAGVMGIATLTYLPFAFFNLLSPVISLILANTGYTMVKNEQGQN